MCYADLLLLVKVCFVWPDVAHQPLFCLWKWKCVLKLLFLQQHITSAHLSHCHLLQIVLAILQMCEVLTSRWVLHGTLSRRNVKCTSNTDSKRPWTLGWVKNCFMRNHTYSMHIHAHMLLPQGHCEDVLLVFALVFYMYLKSVNWKEFKRLSSPFKESFLYESGQTCKLLLQ